MAETVDVNVPVPLNVSGALALNVVVPEFKLVDVGEGDGVCEDEAIDTGVTELVPDTVIGAVKLAEQVGATDSPVVKQPAHGHVVGELEPMGQ